LGGRRRGRGRVARECERLLLTEVRPNEGWNVNTREEETDEIEAEFGRGNIRWKFEAKLDDGETEVYVVQKRTGLVEH